MNSKTIDGHPAVITTIALKELTDELSQAVDISKPLARSVVRMLATIIADHLRLGHSVKVHGLGMFYIRNIPARRAYSLARKEYVDVPGRQRVRFRLTRTQKPGIE